MPVLPPAKVAKSGFRRSVMGKHEGASLSCRIYQRNGWANSVLAIAVIVVLGTLMVTSTSDIVVAAQKEVSQIEDFVMGEVTGKQENVIRIDSKEYSFFADVIVKDQNLTPRALKDVVTGTQVMFHLKQGRIDQIIILLPS
jgi:L-cysteine desulfidase